MTLRAVWIALEADSRPVEISTALVGMALAMSCWFGAWFGTWFPDATALHGIEPGLGVAGLFYNGVHLHRTFARAYLHRQVFAATNCMMLAGMSVASFSAYGWSIPAGPVCAVGALVQCWVYLSLQSDQVDAGRRSGK